MHVIKTWFLLMANKMFIYLKTINRIQIIITQLMKEGKKKCRREE